MKNHTKWILFAGISVILIGMATLWLLSTPNGNTSADLKEQYPQYFGLPTDQGLEIYIYDVSDGNYRCDLLPSKGSKYTSNELTDFPHTTLETMRAIVDTYLAAGVSEKDFTVHYVNNPYYGNYGEPVSEYSQELIEKLFWSDSPAMSLSGFNTIFATAVFDVDGDGVDEVCSLAHGPTSGLYSVCFIAHEVDRPFSKFEYFSMFVMEHAPFSFVETKKGIRIRQDFEDGPIDYTVCINKNGAAVFVKDGEPVPDSLYNQIESRFAWDYE